MKRWRGWGELVIGIHRNLRDAVKGMRCVGQASVIMRCCGTHDGGRVAPAGGEVGAGGG